MAIYPLSVLRALALHTQKLDSANGSELNPSPDSVYETVDQLGAVQIDTLQMVARAHYITLWSRHGAYDPTSFDALANDSQQRRVFEGWYHAACFLPLSEYRYQMPHQRKLMMTSPRKSQLQSGTRMWTTCEIGKAIESGM